ncbi:MAG: anthranilate synthase component I family protein [Pseudomonadota bacterium]
MPKLEINWQEPLDFARRISGNYDENWVFLYSGLSDKIKKSVSIIALFPKEKIVGNDFLEAEKIIKSDKKKWLGYLSYELGQDFEKLPKTEKSLIDLPKIYLMNFALMLEFDHDKKKLTAIFDDKKNLEQVLKWAPFLNKTNIQIKNLSSNFTNESYLAAISDIKNQIAAGDFYQTNLTRKFFGEFKEKQNHQKNFQLFTRLTELSPANYSAFLKIDESYIISSSPELFLKAKNNHILSRPIKGTAPRDQDLKQDKKNKLNLKNSLKERAENLMIVDLVRNDLARACAAGSVVVKKLFEITSYQNIHHMSSEIHGKIAQNLSAFDAIKSCFPAGSMTGAPKIKAMEVAAKKEKLNRGVYSGSIGLFSKNEINSSVVIRTLILQENKFEFQVGGAITFDSDPKAELEETFNKAKGIAQLLQVEVKS